MCTYLFIDISIWIFCSQKRKWIKKINIHQNFSLFEFYIINGIENCNQRIDIRQRIPQFSRQHLINLHDILAQNFRPNPMTNVNTRSCRIRTFIFLFHFDNFQSKPFNWQLLGKKTEPKSRIFCRKMVYLIWQTQTFSFDVAIAFVFALPK